MWPVRKVIPIIPGDYRYYYVIIIIFSYRCSFSRTQGRIFTNLSLFSLCSDLELKPVGMLEVKLVQAKDLTNKDMIGKSDPYALLYIRPLRDRMKKSKIIVFHVQCSFPFSLSCTSYL